MVNIRFLFSQQLTFLIYLLINRHIPLPKGSGIINNERVMLWKNAMTIWGVKRKTA